MKAVSAVALVLQAFGYQVSRSRAKALAPAPVAPPSPPSQGGFVRLDAALVTLMGFLLVFSVLAAALSAGCGASSRERTLRTTYSSLTVAQAAFTAWDLEHQRALVRAATSEADGLAALTKYKADREPVMTAFEVAYRTVAAAGALDDDPSLAGALKAWKQLAAALSALTGGGLP
jgi:hypothetical protein